MATSRQIAPSQHGAVVLLHPEDDSLFERADDRDGLHNARLPLVVAPITVPS